MTGRVGPPVIELIHLAYQLYALLMEQMFVQLSSWDYTTALSLTIRNVGYVLQRLTTTGTECFKPQCRWRCYTTPGHSGT